MKKDIASIEADGISADEAAGLCAVVAISVVGQASNWLDVTACESVIRLLRRTAL